MTTHSDADEAVGEYDATIRLLEPGEARRPHAVIVGTSTATETAPTAPEREGNVEEAEEGNEGEAQSQRTFGSLSPQEAGRRSAQARRDKARAQEERVKQASDGRVVLVRTPVAVGDIIARLSSDAAKGIAASARELREWMREFPAEDETDMSALDSRTRQQVIARVLKDIEDDEGQAPAGPEE